MSSPLVQISNLSWRYSVGDWVLKDINLEIRQGERIGLVGLSGSGKSTLALTLNGIIPQSYAGVMKGRVVVDDHDTAITPVPLLAQKVAMVFQSPDDQVSQILVCHEVASGPANLRLPVDTIRQRVDQAMEQLGISKLAHRETSTLSGGEKQKVALASALAMKPKLLVLDEPTTDLDPKSKYELIRSLSSLGRSVAVVVVSHDLETITPLVDRWVVLENGSIANDTGHLRPALPQKPYRSVSNNGGSDRILKLSGVTYSYPSVDYPTVSDISMSINGGEFVAIVGENGSGKTTLCKLMLGLLKPSSGHVSMFEEAVASVQPERVGYIYQNPDAMLSQMSVSEEVGFTPKTLRHPNWRREANLAIERFGLESLRDRFPLSLSKGQRQRVAYSAVTAAQPPILIFDEPTTGIDHPSVEKIMHYMDELRQNGKTIIFVTHDMGLAFRWADRIVVMKNGKIAFAGTPEELETQQDMLEEWYIRLPQKRR
ncbi:MAG: ABC transporter related protein [Candidatus Woesebacteria bacterium GW2011_GWB1_38_5b]|uniref:ABC transporter related protein n=2 Tax=Candidatus Woeseibacteriota TaxID=1752722 RepID=A0A0G0K5Q8_9BACT|nr:MAG: ABC transporter related protein [Candidatus Woesebacteria bacterium GW2011_GWB1_38_5b]OGM59473.1 MAG: hypothetical protein A2892_02395 [Candidatus Woesebacteria bacterium RIFCSPLOWO2_01_FULL_39_10b]